MKTMNDKNGQAVIAGIALLLKAGVDVRTAIEKVCGEGSFDKLAGMIYDDLRASQGL